MAREVPSEAGRFSSLLLALLVLFAVAPFSRTLPLSELASSLILISGVYAVSRRRRVLWLCLLLAAPALVLEWATRVTSLLCLQAANLGFTAAFLGVVLVTVLTSVLRRERVTADTIAGAICVYLLLGAFFMEIYHLVELLEPGSFERGGVGLSELETLPKPALLYFSYVTLTTLGYGDIVPATSFARSVAVFEAMLGQLYVAIFVARLVALQIAHAGSGRE